ncbi:MAG: DUF4143 domain-containing protein [Acidobacteria bacterium]|nr:DUF4143 domain-containing protein [Acidobacteriota bacterium]
MTVVERFFRPPAGSFFLFGPRGVGKTTWFRANVPDALVLDLLVGSRYRELSSHPERLRDLVVASASRDIVIDEIQRVPELLHSVHDLIETDRSRRFILTGSSARKLRARGANLLGGRAANRTLHPFLAAELGDGFDLPTALRQGLLPVVVSATDPAAALDGYVSLYVDEEVRTEGLIRDVGRFARFLEAMSFSHGAVLNLSGVAREAEARRPTVQGHLEILEDLLLAFRVPVFTKRAKRRLASHPKFFFFDCGLYRTLRRTGPLDRPQEIEGAALEGLVAQHLRAWAAYGDRGARLFTWRTRSDAEVDFVIYGPEEFAAIEVKNSRRVRPEDLRGQRSFGDEYPEAMRLLLYRGQDRLLVGDVLCLPVADFLRRLRPDRSLAVVAKWPTRTLAPK